MFFASGRGATRAPLLNETRLIATERLPRVPALSLTPPTSAQRPGQEAHRLPFLADDRGSSISRYANHSRGPTMFGEVTAAEMFAKAFGARQEAERPFRGRQSRRQKPVGETPLFTRR